MIIDTHLHPTNLVGQGCRKTGTPFIGLGLRLAMQQRSSRPRAARPSDRHLAWTTGR